jgi:radical SAM protein with 4Fe4S-binding SPASM domain
MTVNTSVNCIAAYNSICINPDGSLEPCCQYHRDTKTNTINFTEFNEYQNTIQQSMHQDAEVGIQHTGCSKCWSEESAGWHSLRQVFNKWYLPDASSKIDADNPIYDIELRLGNFCNLKCIMCWPSASSSVALERSQNFTKFQSIGIGSQNVRYDYYWETPEFWEFSEKLFKDARRVNITGGEPFIIPEVLKIINYLLPKKDTVILSFNTNLTKVSDKLIDHLRPFKRLSIVVSLEGVGEMNDYLRFPSNWNEILENFIKIKTQLPHAQIAVNHTFQHSSIYALPGLIEFCETQQIELKLTSVQGNDRLTINSVPQKDIDKFKIWLTNSEYPAIMKQQIFNFIDNCTYDPVLHKKYVEYMDVLDEIRGTNYYKVFDQETKYIDN